MTISGQVLSEERPYIPMWSYNNLVGASKTQEGFQMNPCLCVSL